jgi:hypothetical protein
MLNSTAYAALLRIIVSAGIAANTVITDFTSNESVQDYITDRCAEILKKTVIDVQGTTAMIQSSTLEESIRTGVAVYKRLHNGTEPDRNRYEAFLTRTSFLFAEGRQKIIFDDDSVRIIADYRGSNFSIDYDYGIEDSIFIIRNEENEYNAKECTINTIQETLESYFETIPESITTAA